MDEIFRNGTIDCSNSGSSNNEITLSEEQNQATPDPALIEMFTNMVNEMFSYGRHILEERRKSPKDDLLSVIANIEIDGKKLPNEYLDGSWLLIIFAGNDTTRNSISGTMNLLSQNQDQKELVLNDRSLIPNMVHESIRVANPVTYMRRTTKVDTQIGDQKIGPNEKYLYGTEQLTEILIFLKILISMTLEEKMQKTLYLLDTEDISV